MSISLFNTLSARREIFTPGREDAVTMYVCGPTVYNRIHVGNARPVVVFDTLFRLLKLRYQNVIYARNITDIDDKIIAVAARSSCSVSHIAAQYTQSFHEDIDRLNVLEPTVEPRAVEHVPQMIDTIELLIENGHAYEAENHVLFEVSTMPDYGCLSKRDRDDMIAGARVETAPYKRDPMDFVLWKPSSEQQPGWDSPWGRGRPGWHLECSTMAHTHLGEVIDIHGGGQDLVFPHHENEIAQSCGARGHDTFARYWIHNGYITVKGEKMSKSLGNFIVLGDILKKFHGEVVRLALLSTHYHKPLDWSEDALHEAKHTLDKWYRCLLEQDARDDEEEATDTQVLDALSDDLNTPGAIAEMHKLAKHRLGTRLRASGALLGVLQESPADWFRWTPPKDRSMDEAHIRLMVDRRQQARLDKDFATADKIRLELEQSGIMLEDHGGKTNWRRR